MKTMFMAITEVNDPNNEKTNEGNIIVCKHLQIHPTVS